MSLQMNQNPVPFVLKAFPQASIVVIISSINIGPQWMLTFVIYALKNIFKMPQICISGNPTYTHSQDNIVAHIHWSVTTLTPSGGFNVVENRDYHGKKCWCENTRCIAACCIWVCVAVDWPEWPMIMSTLDMSCKKLEGFLQHFALRDFGPVSTKTEM